MNIKYYLLGIIGILFIVSCNNEDITDSVTEPVTEVKKYTPIVNGVFGSFTDKSSSARAGVEEGNENYQQGEKFYWHDGDQAALLFYKDGDLNQLTDSIVYTAVVSGDNKSKSANFITTSETQLEAGNYTVYGLYPAAGWSLNEDGKLTATMDLNVLNGIGESSEYLSRNMFMKSEAVDVAIGEELSNSIDLSYRHLGGVIRFHIRNENVNHPRLTQLIIAKMLGEDENNLINFYPLQAYLEDISTNVLIPVEGQISSGVILNVDSEADGLKHDIFIPFLPIDGFTETQTFGIRFSFEEGGPLPTTYYLDNDDIPFVEQGFLAGYSYYFNLTQWVSSNSGGNDAAE